METDELKKIWQTLSHENLIDKSIAKENIERIIRMKSSRTIERISKKLRFDYWTNIISAVLVLLITIFATIYLNYKNHSLPVHGYVFLILVISYFSINAASIHSKLKLLRYSYNTSSILDSLIKVKSRLEKVSIKESVIMYVPMTFLTIFANIVINDKTDFSKFSFNSLQGYVFIFSIGYLISLPFIGKYYFRKRFSGPLTDVNNLINELNSEKE